VSATSKYTAARLAPWGPALPRLVGHSPTPISPACMTDLVP
jgi:hypothetical protein